MKDSIVNYREEKLRGDIARLSSLVEKFVLDREAEGERPSYFDYFNFELGEPETFVCWDESNSVKWFIQYRKFSLSLLEIELAKLRRLLSGLKSSVLSRTLIDHKKAFRTKVQFLFKNLDDAHATILIRRLPRKTISYTQAFPITWNKIKYKKHYFLRLQY